MGDDSALTWNAHSDSRAVEETQRRCMNTEEISKQRRETDIKRDTSTIPERSASSYHTFNMTALYVWLVCICMYCVCTPHSSFTPLLTPQLLLTHLLFPLPFLFPLLSSLSFLFPIHFILHILCLNPHSPPPPPPQMYKP
jgi:hypothetical protein